MEIFKNTPCDIVNCILSYDERFTIKKGNVHITPLKERYKTFIQLLEKKIKWSFEESKKFYPYVCYILSDNFMLHFENSRTDILEKDDYSISIKRVYTPKKNICSGLIYSN